MTLSRRQLLKAAGTTAAVFAVSSNATAADTDERTADSDDEGSSRVFVHPERTGLLGDVLGVIDDVGGSVLLEFDNFDFVVAELPSGAREELAGDSRVAFIEDDDRIGVPNPPFPPIFGGGSDDCDAHPEQRPSWGWERIGAGETEETGAGVDVAVLDTGVQTDHCALDVAGGRNVTDDGSPTDYDDGHGHGTHCAGIACAPDNGIGVVGVAPEATLHAVKVLDDDGSGYQSWIAAGIDWCLSEEIELISMSVGGGERTDAVDEAIETATDQGHLLVAAAGNGENGGGEDCTEGNVAYPASHEDVIAVAAMDEDDSLAGYSSLGDQIELLAPGSRIESTDVDNRYSERSGTSMACPFVTGVAALCWERSDTAGPGPNASIRDIMRETAEPVLDSCAEGHGLVNAPGATDGERPETDDGGPVDDGGVGGTVVGGLRAVVGRIGDAVRRFFAWLAGLF